MRNVILTKDVGVLKKGQLIKNMDHFAAYHLVNRGDAEFTSDDVDPLKPKTSEAETKTPAKKTASKK